MLIPITIGYDGDKKVVNDLVDLDHLLVYLSEEQMSSMISYSLPGYVDKIYETIKNKNYTLFPLYFYLKNGTNMAHVRYWIREYYKNMEDRYDLFINFNSFWKIFSPKII